MKPSIALCALILASYLTACTPGNSKKNGYVVSYSRAQQAEVAHELENCADCDATIEFMKDYKVERDIKRGTTKPSVLKSLGVN